MQRTTRLLLLPLLALLTTTDVRAQAVTIGGPADGTISFPFTVYQFQLPNRYQQLYTASNFTGPVFIDAIRFANTRSTAAGIPATVGIGEYLLRLAVTDRPENGLGTNFDANIGGFSSTFFSGVVGGGSQGFLGTPYLYDPSRGNLLLDVTVLSQTTPLGLGFDFSRSSTDGTSRAFHTSPLPPTGSFPVAADALGLITTFETRVAASVVPEPSSVLLVAAGLAGVAVLQRRRRRRR